MQSQYQTRIFNGLSKFDQLVIKFAHYLVLIPVAAMIALSCFALQPQNSLAQTALPAPPPQDFAPTNYATEFSEQGFDPGGILENLEQNLLAPLGGFMNLVKDFAKATFDAFVKPIGQIVGSMLALFIKTVMAPFTTYLMSILKWFVINPNIPLALDNGANASNPITGGQINPFSGSSKYDPSLHNMQVLEEQMKTLALDISLLLFVLAIWRQWIEGGFKKAGGGLMGPVGRFIFTMALMLTWREIYKQEINITNEMTQAIFFNSPTEFDLLNSALIDAMMMAIAAGTGLAIEVFAPVVGAAVGGAAFNAAGVVVGGAIGAIIGFVGLVMFAIFGGILIVQLCYLLVLKATQTAMLVGHYIFSPMYLVFYASPDTQHISNAFMKSFVEVSLWTFAWMGLFKIMVIVIASQATWGKLLIVIGLLQIMIQVPKWVSEARINPESHILDHRLAFNLMKEGFHTIGGAVSTAAPQLGNWAQNGRLSSVATGRPTPVNVNPGSSSAGSPSGQKPFNTPGAAGGAAGAAAGAAGAAGGAAGAAAGAAGAAGGAAGTATGAPPKVKTPGANLDTAPPAVPNPGASPPTSSNPGTSPPVVPNPGASPPTGSNPGASPPTSSNPGASPPTSSNPGVSPPAVPNLGAPPLHTVQGAAQTDFAPAPNLHDYNDPQAALFDGESGVADAKFVDPGSFESMVLDTSCGGVKVPHPQTPDQNLVQPRYSDRDGAGLAAGYMRPIFRRRLRDRETLGLPSYQWRTQPGDEANDPIKAGARQTPQGEFVPTMTFHDRSGREITGDVLLNGQQQPEGIMLANGGLISIGATEPANLEPQAPLLQQTSGAHPAGTQPPNKQSAPGTQSPINPAAAGAQPPIDPASATGAKSPKKTAATGSEPPTGPAPVPRLMQTPPPNPRVEPDGTPRGPISPVRQLIERAHQSYNSQNGVTMASGPQNQIRLNEDNSASVNHVENASPLLRAQLFNAAAIASELNRTDDGFKLAGKNAVRGEQVRGRGEGTQGVLTGLGNRINSGLRRSSHSTNNVLYADTTQGRLDANDRKVQGTLFWSTNGQAGEDNDVAQYLLSTKGRYGAEAQRLDEENSEFRIGPAFLAADAVPAVDALGGQAHYRAQLAVGTYIATTMADAGVPLGPDEFSRAAGFAKTIEPYTAGACLAISTRYNDEKCRDLDFVNTVASVGAQLRPHKNAYDDALDAVVYNRSVLGGSWTQAGERVQALVQLGFSPNDLINPKIIAAADVLSRNGQPVSKDEVQKQSKLAKVILPQSPQAPPLVTPPHGQGA